MYPCGPQHMDVQKQDDQHELTYSNNVRTQDVTLKTCRRRWMIGRSGERGSGISCWRCDIMMMMMTVILWVEMLALFPLVLNSRLFLLLYQLPDLILVEAPFYSFKVKVRITADYSDSNFFILLENCKVCIRLVDLFYNMSTLIGLFKAKVILFSNEKIDSILNVCNHNYIFNVPLQFFKTQHFIYNLSSIPISF